MKQWVKREKPINIDVEFILPDDLRFYFENYTSIPTIFTE